MALITDKITEVANGQNPVATTVTSPRVGGGTTLATANLAGWPTNTAVHFATYKIDGAGAKVAGTQIDWKGIVSGTNINSLTRKAGASDGGSAVGDVVMMMPTAYWGQELAEALELEHTNTGTHKDITATSVTTSAATLTNPKVITGINDTNGNELIKVTATGSAINEITVANAAIGNAPTISASGGDTNIDLKLTPKGTGNVKKGSNNIDWWEELGRTTLTGSGSTVAVSSFAAKKYLKIIFCLYATGGAIDAAITFNGDTGANYALRFSTNGGADTSVTSVNSIAPIDGALSNPIYYEMEFQNFATQEKVGVMRGARGNTAGAGTSPQRFETAFKWANTANQVTTVSVSESQAGSYAIGSEVVVLGHD